MKPACFLRASTSGRRLLGACVDRSVIQRAHTVSIMGPFVVCVRSGRGDTGGLPNKNTCCKQEAGLPGENEDCMFDLASFFPPNLM